MMNLALAALLILIGLFWMGQGLGYVKGGAMSGQRIWLFVGLVCVVAGAAIAIWRGHGLRPQKPLP